MPTPTRTRPPTNIRTTYGKQSPQPQLYTADDILSRGVSVTDLPDDPVHALIYGKNGVGKTTLACQWVAEGQLALVSIENAGQGGGAASIKKMPNVTQFRFRTTEEVEQFGRRLHDTHPFKVVVLDSGSSLDAVGLADVCKWEDGKNMPVKPFGKISTDQYVERTERVRQVLRPYVDLPITVIFLANERDHNYKLPEDDKGKKKLVAAMLREVQDSSFVSADMSAGTVKWLSDCCDYLCRLYVDKEVEIKERTVNEGKPNQKTIQEVWETGRWVRRLLTSYHPNFAARVRSPDPESIPQYIEGTSPKDLYLKFAAMARGEKISEG